MKRLFLFIASFAFISQAKCPRSCTSGSPWYDASGYAEGASSFFQTRCRKDRIDTNMSGPIYPNQQDFLEWNELEDEWEIKTQYYLYSPPDDIEPLQRLMYMGYIANGANNALFQVFYDWGRFTFECFTCDDSSHNNFQLPFGQWFNLRVRQVRIFTSYNTLSGANYKSGSLYLELYHNELLVFRLRQKDNIFSATTKYDIILGPFMPPKISLPFIGSVPDLNRAALFSTFQLKTTKVQTCNECSAGEHDCVQNAQCNSDNNEFFINEYSSDVSCYCLSGFAGEGKRECRSCNTDYNCMRMREGCSGSWPFDWNQNHLTDCLSGASNDILLNNIVHKRKTINGLRSNKPISFFESENRFIFFDQEYQKWRIGGTIAQTVNADCSSLNIC